SLQKLQDVICINDDSGSSESLPQLNNVSSLQQHRKYKPAVINISDGSNDGGSSESLPQLNNVISLQRRSKYKPAVINIGDGSGPSHHRKKASKDKQKKHTSDGEPGWKL
uniref:Uncharacterized protein n=1 Tax=Aegilops tauschii subsp. strangulata TaxID=200361 RepID=A0A453SA89_AEGTS